jgi:hypothetical protein
MTRINLSKIERLSKEYNPELPEIDPNEEDHGSECARCHTTVHVESDLEFERGDICYLCATEYFYEMRNSIDVLTKSLRESREALEHYSMGGSMKVNPIKIESSDNLPDFASITLECGTRVAQECLTKLDAAIDFGVEK